MKRQAEDAEAPPSKRARPNPLTNLLRELKLQIVLKDLISDDRKDARRALPNILAIAHTNRTFRALVNSEFGGKATRRGGGKAMLASEKISKLVARVERGVNAVGQLSYPVSVDTMDELLSRKIALDADRIGLMPVNERGGVVREAIALPDGDDKLETLHGLVRNLACLEAKDGILLVDAVCKFQHENGSAETLIKAAIEQSGHLQPPELAKLARTAIEIEQPAARQDCLTALAGRMARLDEMDQFAVLETVRTSDHARGRSLGAFATNLADVSGEHRPAVIEAVLALPDDEPGRMWAMSGLAEHLDLAEPDAAHRIAADILRRGQDPQERAADDGAWFAEPAFCAIEAIHHLQHHALVEDAAPQTNDVIRGILDAPHPDLPRQAQLITHMKKGQRQRFVARALRQVNLLRQPGLDTDTDSDFGADPAADPAVNAGRIVDDHLVAALTIRLRSLSPDETTAYVDHVCAEDAGQSVLRDEILDQAMAGRFGHFQRTEITKLVRNRLETMERYETVDDCVRIFAGVARNAKLLTASDLQSVFKAARRQGAKMSRDGEEDGVAAARQMAALSAHALADWSTAQLDAVIQRPVELVDPVQRERADAVYDERPHDRTPVR